MRGGGGCEEVVKVEVEEEEKEERAAVSHVQRHSWCDWVA